jgi:hypothetical protein
MGTVMAKALVMDLATDQEKVLATVPVMDLAKALVTGQGKAPE